mmetsp:Transcript_40723/g.121473  ORF Transcript_40723/g.121473 Transcript_40723/m.121473 type:complete len:211 (+) Transcript_40723:1645-2277(+)
MRPCSRRSARRRPRCMRCCGAPSRRASRSFCSPARSCTSAPRWCSSRARSATSERPSPPTWGRSARRPAPATATTPTRPATRPAGRVCCRVRRCSRHTLSSAATTSTSRRALWSGRPTTLGRPQSRRLCSSALAQTAPPSWFTARTQARSCGAWRATARRWRPTWMRSRASRAAFGLSPAPRCSCDAVSQLRCGPPAVTRSASCDAICQL